MMRQEKSMRRTARIVMTVAFIAALPMLAGCSTFDPDSLDVFGLTEKKKLPGERKALFPEGVPGVQPGVPQQYLKGNQPTGDAALTPPVQGAPVAAVTTAPAAAPDDETPPAAAAAPAEKPKVAPRRKVAAKPPAKPRPAAAAPVQPVSQDAAPQQQAQPQQAPEPWPAPAAPAQSSGTAAWPAPPPAGTFSR